MTEVTDKITRAARRAYRRVNPFLTHIDHPQALVSAIEAALAAQSPASIRCPECAKANAARDERFGRKP